jgi:hypothetical protein
MDNLLKSYVLDQENPSLNFELARCYHENLDYSSAVSFYLRAKERTTDIEMQNKCIEYLIDCSKELKKNYLVSELEKYYNKSSEEIVQFNLENLKTILHQEVSKDKNADIILQKLYTDQDVFGSGVEYKKAGQFIPAALNFIKSIETQDEINLRYECLIHIGECLDKVGNKIDLVFDIYKKAITIAPKRPEAYYMLANFQNWHGYYENAYSVCHTALDGNCDFDSSDFIFKSKYPGKWGLLYELTTSSLHCNESMETRKVLQDILNNYWEQLDDYHKEITEYRLCSLGSGPPEVAITPYDSSKHSQLRYKFPGSENIKRNYSQVYQDMFILSILDGKRNGTFLEIGGAEPFHMNNTALLETEFGWNGVSIEYKKEFVDQYKEQRPTKAYCLDALSIDYDKFIDENFDSNIIDYLQLDIEPARNTYELLQKIPFEKFKFRVITYEHDHYVDVTKECRKKSREYLESKGYLLLVNDISPEGSCNFEDWWVHPDLIDLELIKKMSGNNDKIKKAETFMLSPFIPKKNVVDCFPFFYEKELLELRVNLLKDYVDEIIVCEMNRTHSGSEKEFIAKDTIKELGLPEDKVRVIEVCIPDDDEIEMDEGDIFHGNDAKSSKPKNSTRERMQRDSLMNVLDEYSDDTVFILSDCDEIINPKFIPYFSEAIRKTDNNIIKVPLICFEGRADNRVYDGDEPLGWRHSMVVCTKNHLINGGSPTIFRGNYNNPFPPTWIETDGECGWHFTFMGSKEIRKYKAESCAHSDNLDVYYNLTSDTIKEIGGTVSNDSISLRDYNWSLLPREIFESKRVFDYLLPPK